MKIALLLLALGFGYKIFAEAKTDAKKSLKRLGQIVGVYIMVVSLVGSLCTLWAIARYGKWEKGAYWHCPFTAKKQLQTSPTEPPSQ